MKTVSIEVKSIYSIRIEFSDFSKIFAKAKDDPGRLNAFSRFDLEDTTIGNIRKCFKMLEHHFGSSEECHQACEDLQYVVRKLGFDGIDNYGGFFKDDDMYHCTVYNRGADI